MIANTPLPGSQRIVQVCLLLFAAICLFGGALQMYLGQPQTAPRLDNVHRFMAGVYFGTGIICLWAGITVRQQGVLVYLLALGVLLAGSLLWAFSSPAPGDWYRSARWGCPSPLHSG